MWQALGDGDARKRSAAFPFELAYRLINMYSVKGDTVLDPFWGTGTTTMAAITAARNSVGCEIDPHLDNIFSSDPDALVSFANDTISDRLYRHHGFVQTRLEADKPLKHVNSHYGFPVVTAQEKNLLINPVASVEKKDAQWLTAVYSDTPTTSHMYEGQQAPEEKTRSLAQPKKKRGPKKKSNVIQLELF